MTMLHLFVIFFFFSSRRRHTRSLCDWSSDVCSSDLPGRTSMFEPVHGSAPPLAGKNVANPMGAILSVALLLETLGRRDAAARVERAVEAAVHEGPTTPDIGGRAGTREVGEWVVKRLQATGDG